MQENDIAFKLITCIVDNELAVGAKLPSIRELSALWQCNQSQVRTGLISLSTLGIIDMHSRAGSFVKQLSPSDLDTLFVLFFRLGMLGKDSDTINIYAIKTILDTETIHNAIKYRTDNDLFQLEENLSLQVTSLDDCDAFVYADGEFHVHIAQISRNPLIVFLLEAIQVMLRPYRHKNLTRETCRQSYESHVAILHTATRIQRLRTRKEPALETGK